MAWRRRSRRSRVQTTAMIKRGRAYYWTAAEDRLLGKQPDAEVARLVGRAMAAVTRRRQEAGIIFRPNPRWTKAEDRLLGTVSDEVLAKKLGHSRTQIGARRCKLGIAGTRRDAPVRRGSVSGLTARQSRITLLA